MNSVIPATCCILATDNLPLDLNCPIFPSATNAFTTTCYDLLYKTYVAQFYWGILIALFTFFLIVEYVVVIPHILPILLFWEWILELFCLSRYMYPKEAKKPTFKDYVFRSV